MSVYLSIRPSVCVYVCLCVWKVSSIPAVTSQNGKLKTAEIKQKKILVFFKLPNNKTLTLDYCVSRLVQFIIFWNWDVSNSKTDFFLIGALV